MITHRYLFVLSFFFLASCGQVVAQSTAESRVDKLEETVRSLERRVATLEDQLHQRNAAASIPPDKVNWRRLKKGLSEADVERLLGSPTKVEGGLITTWHYGEGDGRGASVEFYDGAVSGWSEP
ncbi:hypothetical protein [Pseudomonas sp. G5(2012)]|uniref:hypothetical protein n=1 Tax=Pseudomonas sp. G5(2012) TaxID=1268068 RepID=UPI000343235C|nr:hypothetical protein [Pseudomonas sp. G5(2012)]EPA95239.1 hypothetical protein PG5_42170 [Pseudomonas sp. G5(2012)]